MNQREWRLSHWACEMLERILLSDVPIWVTAVETGTYLPGASDAQRFATENNRKYRGIKPHALDLDIYQAPLRAFFELKIGTNKPSENQFTTMRMANERRIPSGWGNSLRQVYVFVSQCGFRLHLNAANIVVEIEARHAAAEREAEVERPVKKRAAPRQAKPTAAKLRAVAAVRERVRF